MVIIYIFQLLLIPPLFGEKSQKAEANIYLCILLSLLVQESSSNIVSSFVLLMGLDFTFGGHLPRIKKNLHSLSQCTYQNLSAKAALHISKLVSKSRFINQLWGYILSKLCYAELFPLWKLLHQFQPEWLWTEWSKFGASIFYFFWLY